MFLSKFKCVPVQICYLNIYTDNKQSFIAQHFCGKMILTPKGLHKKKTDLICNKKRKTCSSHLFFFLFFACYTSISLWQAHVEIIAHFRWIRWFKTNEIDNGKSMKKNPTEGKPDEIDTHSKINMLETVEFYECSYSSGLVNLNMITSRPPRTKATDQ